MRQFGYGNSKPLIDTVRYRKDVKIPWSQSTPIVRRFFHSQQEKL